MHSIRIVTLHLRLSRAKSPARSAASDRTEWICLLARGLPHLWTGRKRIPGAAPERAFRRPAGSRSLYRAGSSFGCGYTDKFLILKRFW